MHLVRKKEKHFADAWVRFDNFLEKFHDVSLSSERELITEAL